MSKNYSTKDRRGLVWVNEVGALRALAHYQNIPMYVSEIARSVTQDPGASRAQGERVNQARNKGSLLAPHEKKDLGRGVHENAEEGQENPRYH